MAGWAGFSDSELRKMKGSSSDEHGKYFKVLSKSRLSLTRDFSEAGCSEWTEKTENRFRSFSDTDK